MPNVLAADDEIAVGSSAEAVGRGHFISRNRRVQSGNAQRISDHAFEGVTGCALGRVSTSD